MLFTTDRLIVRHLKVSDLDTFHLLQANPNVMRYTGDSIRTLEEDKADLLNIIDLYKKKDNTFWIWAITRKTDHAFIGTCALLKNEPQPNDPVEDEIGYRIIEDYWGNGYGSEIVPALINYAFNKFGMNSIVGEVDELNIPSVKILEKHMTFVKGYYCEKYKSNDRQYRIEKKDFISDSL